jgi:TRAP-type C4-dicarboxylate transport system permease small subunit
MIVASAGRARLPSFILGLLCVIFAFALILYMYSYTSGLASSGYTILEAKEVPQLFLFIGCDLSLGVFGGYEIGRFVEASNEKKASHQKQ